MRVIAIDDQLATVVVWRGEGWKERVVKRSLSLVFAGWPVSLALLLSLRPFALSNNGYNGQAQGKL